MARHETEGHGLIAEFEQIGSFESVAAPSIPSHRALVVGGDIHFGRPVPIKVGEYTGQLHGGRPIVEKDDLPLRFLRLHQPKAGAAAPRDHLGESIGIDITDE